MKTFSLVIRLEPDNIVVTKLFSEYCNAARSVVHESHTSLFQCSSPIVFIGFYKVTNFINLLQYKHGYNQ